MKKYVLLAALAASSMAATATEIVIATGSEGGSYERRGYNLANAIGKQIERAGERSDFEIINTNGSLENIELMDAGQAHMALVQADALNVQKPKVSFRAKTSHKEYVWWIYNLNHKKTDIEDIEGSKDFSIVMVDESGATVTLDSFAMEDSGYEKNVENAVYADDLYEAADMVCEGRSEDGQKVAGMLYVGGSLPAEVAADFKQCIGVGEATDSDFNDAKDVNGDKLYVNCEISKAQLKGLTAGSWGKQSTVCVNAMVIHLKDFGDKKVNKAVKKGVTKALRGK